jgi:hypothetical protein
VPAWKVKATQVGVPKRRNIKPGIPTFDTRTCVNSAPIVIAFRKLVKWP